MLKKKKKLTPHLQRLFYARKTVTCCFLDIEYMHTVRAIWYQNRTFQLHDNIDKLVEAQLNKNRKEFYEK